MKIMRLREWTDYWAKRRYIDGVFGRRTKSYDTLRRIKSSLDLLSSCLHPNFVLDVATEEDVIHLMDNVRKTRKTPQSQNAVVKVFRLCFEDAAKHGRDGWRMRLDNPLLNLHLVKEPRELPKFLRLDTTEAVMEIAIARGPEAGAVTLAITCGLRRREVERLRWRHIIEHEDGTATIDVTSEIGKGGVARQVPLGRRALASLGDRPVRADERVVDLYPETAWKLVREAARFRLPKSKAELDRCTFHALRHSCARWMHYRAGIGIPALRDFLGHSNVNTTMRYLEGGHEARQEMAAKVDEVVT